MSEREARILARQKARKNRKPIQDSNLEPFKNGDFEHKDDTRPMSKKSSSEVSNIAEGSLEADQILDGQVRKKKRKEREEAENVIDSNHANVLDSKRETEVHKEIVSEPSGNANETELGKPKRIKMKKQKALEGKNGISLDPQEIPPKKKKKKKAVPKLKGNDENHLSTGVPEDDNVSENNEPKKPQEPPGTGFTIMEEFHANKNNKVFRVLPTWLAKPSVISCDLSKNKVPIKEINGIDKFLIDALKRNKIEHFFPGIYLISQNTFVIF